MGWAHNNNLLQWHPKSSCSKREKSVEYQAVWILTLYSEVPRIESRVGLFDWGFPDFSVTPGKWGVVPWLTERDISSLSNRHYWRALSSYEYQNIKLKIILQQYCNTHCLSIIPIAISLDNDLFSEWNFSSLTLILLLLLTICFSYFHRRCSQLDNQVIWLLRRYQDKRYITLLVLALSTLIRSTMTFDYKVHCVMDD